MTTSKTCVAVALDVDGVLIKGKAPIPGAAQVLQLFHDELRSFSI